VPEKNCFRQYGITVDRNLLDEWVVTCSWRRIGGRQRMRAIYFDFRNEALVLAEKIAQRRLSRGYQVSAFE
jgi:predicted DNA-binding WGR domain protein